MSPRVSATALVLFLAAAWGRPGAAQGHGPIYGLAPPTLGRGGWSLDVASMARLGRGARSAMLRPLLSYGLTEDLQLSASLPVSIERDAALPRARAFTRMPATQDVELMVGWRFQRSGTAVGSRLESTAWVALDYPADAVRGGVEATPGLFGSVVTGYASRGLYLWAGGAYRRAAATDGPVPDKAGDVTMASVVVGYRPRAFRRDYPAPDWRGFLEIVGEWRGRDRVAGATLPSTGGQQVYLALTFLGLCGWWGISGGPAFPIHQNVSGGAASERLRLALNATVWR